MRQPRLRRGPAPRRRHPRRRRPPRRPPRPRGHGRRRRSRAQALPAPPRTGPGPGTGGPTRRPRRRPASRAASLEPPNHSGTADEAGSWTYSESRSPVAPEAARKRATPSSRSRPRRWKSTAARSYSPSWMPTPSPSTKRPPERSWSAVACFATASGRRSRVAARRCPGSGGRGDGGDGQGRQGLAHGVRPEEMVDRPERVGSGGLGPPAELHQVRGALPVPLPVLLKVGRRCWSGVLPAW